MKRFKLHTGQMPSPWSTQTQSANDKSNEFINATMITIKTPHVQIDRPHRLQQQWCHINHIH